MGDKGEGGVKNLKKLVISFYHLWTALTIFSREKIIYNLFYLYLGILGKWMEVILNIESIRVNDTILGIICVVILLCMRVRITNIFLTEYLIYKQHISKEI